jgi:hypothetical protein
MPHAQAWSFIYHLDGRAQPNESLPSKDVFYSLNVILGLASLGAPVWQKFYDLPALLAHNSRRMFKAGSPKYAYGTALWAAAELGVSLPDDVTAELGKFIRNRDNWKKFRAQDLGMILIGICEQKIRGNTEYDDVASDLFAHLDRYFTAPSGLFYDQASGLRKNFSSFATLTYLTTACYHYGTAYNSARALQLADTATLKIISLQGRNGEWPWFYYADKGIVVDPYEVYSVHQHGMAALFLEFAERRNVVGAHDALIKGFNWIFGQNQFERPMMVPERGMFYRSIIRRGELASSRKRAMRAILNGITNKSEGYTDPADLTLRLECRSYELGWILYSFGTRTDVPFITKHPLFISALAHSAEQSR